MTGNSKFYAPMKGCTGKGFGKDLDLSESVPESNASTGSLGPPTFAMRFETKL